MFHVMTFCETVPNLPAIQTAQLALRQCCHSSSHISITVLNDHKILMIKKNSWRSTFATLKINIFYHTKNIYTTVYNRAARKTRWMSSITNA